MSPGRPGGTTVRSVVTRQRSAKAKSSETVTNR
jgi:hypothetical protein